MIKFIVVKFEGKYKKLFVHEILYCKANGAYTAFYFKSKNDIVLASLMLKEVEKMLANTNFFRINRSCLVNLDHCHELICRSNQIVLSNEKKLAVSRSKMKLLIIAFCAYS